MVSGLARELVKRSRRRSPDSTQYRGITAVRSCAGKGVEFVNEAVEDMSVDFAIFDARAGGRDPQAHGRAERCVGRRNQRSTSQRFHLLECRCWPCAGAALLLVARALEVNL